MEIWHPWFGKLFRCPCKQAEDAQALQSRLGTPTKPVTLANLIDRGPDSRAMKQAAAQFVSGSLTFLTIWGNNGTGKTTALMAVTNEIIAQGKACIYVTAADAMTWIKDGIGDDYSAEGRVDTLAAVPALCLDELTQVNWTDYVTEKLETILDRRYRAELQTAMAMDQDPQDVLSTRFASRMQAGAYLKIGEIDMRPKAREMFKREAYERGE